MQQCTCIIIHVLIIAYSRYQLHIVHFHEWISMVFTSIFLSCKCAMFFFPHLIVSISLYILVYLYYYFIWYSVHFWHWKRIVGLDWPRIHPCWIAECYATCSCKDHYTSSHTRAHTHTHISLVLRLSKMAETKDAGFCYHCLSDSVKWK